MADVIAYLIERADPKNPGCVMGASFLGVSGSYDGLHGAGTLAWLSRAEDALQFARQKDAAMFVGMMQLLSDQLLHSNTLPGLRGGDPRAIVVEHAWVD